MLYNGDTAWVGPVNVDGEDKTFLFFRPDPNLGKLSLCNSGATINVELDSDGFNFPSIVAHFSDPCTEPEQEQ